MDDIFPVLDDRQFGNIKGSSTTHYLVSLLDSVLSGTDKPGLVASLCAIDYTKAFDHIDHNIVISKLIHLGVNLCSYLEFRSHCVRLGTSISHLSETSCGVPQGTKLGPILFLVMINDAVTTIPLRWKYVDDLTVAEIRNHSQESKLQEIVSPLTLWSSNNHMIPKPEKCKVMHVSFMRNK